MKAINLTLTLKKLLLFGIPALAILGIFTAGFIVTTGEISSLKKELAEKVGKKDLARVLARRDASQKETPSDTNSPTVEKVDLGFIPQEPYEEVMVDYFAAETWQDRVSLVLHPETTEPRMKRHYFYAKRGYDLEAVEIFSIDGKSNVGVGEYIRLLVYNRDRRDGTVNSHLYYVARIRDGYKIDWEASMGKNPMTWKAYLAQRPTRPMLFRVAAKLSHYYNYEFMNAQDTYLSIELAGNTLPLIYGYVRRGSKSGKRMYEILKDGEYHHLIVKIRFLAGDHPGSNTVLIDELVSEDWTIEESKEFAQ